MSQAETDTPAVRGGARTTSEDHRIQREIKYFRDFAAVYSDAIRSSDFKANIALLFLPLLMVPILSAHEKNLAHVPLWLILAPFLIAYFFLILAIFPRYLRSEKSTFHLSRTASADHFTFTHDLNVELEDAKHRIAFLSRILFWKTLYLRLSLGVCLVAIPVFGALLAVYGV
jgi:pycsar effector protein